MKAKGQIKIEGIKEPLNNPSLEINKVNYDWINHTVDVECIFQEEGANYKHSRTFTFSTDGSGELTTADIVGFIKNHDILKAFKI